MTFSIKHVLQVILACTTIGCTDQETEPTCTPGATRTCSCDGASGTQDCSSAGIWSSCRGCGATATDSSLDTSPEICTSGSKEPCTCDNGKESDRTCQDNLWGPCSDCDDPFCSPNSEEPCTCYGGSPGTRTCEADGSAWGACTDCETNQTETACGEPPLTCQQETEICVLDTAAFFEYSCQPLPLGCDQDRTCACADSLCQEPYNICKEWSAENTINCDCEDCD